MTTLVQLLEETTKVLALPYVPGMDGGGGRILIGAWLCVQDKENAISKAISNWVVNNRGLLAEEAPKISVDPVGALLGFRPMNDFDAWLRAPVPLAVRLYSPAFAGLVRRHLPIVVETCIVNDVEAVLPLEDATVVNRIWQQTVALTSICKSSDLADFTGSEEELRQLAIKALADLQPSIKSRIHKNWASPEIHRRDGGPLVLKRRYSILGIPDPCPIVAAAHRWQEGLSAGTGKGTSVQIGAKGYGNEDIRLVQHEGGIGAGLFIDLARGAIDHALKKGDELEIGASAVALLVSSFTLPDSIRDLACRPQGDCVLVESILSPLAEYSDWDHSLLFSQGAPFLRVLPVEMHDLISHLKDIAPEIVRREATLFLRSIDPAISIEMVTEFLRTQATLFFGLPRTFPAFGFARDGVPFAFGGWIAYARHNAATATRLATKYYESIGVDPEPLLTVSEHLGSCGSGGVMLPDVAREIFSILQKRLDEPVSINTGIVRICDIARWNGTVALYALALQALSFRRPYPFAFPRMVGCPGQFEVSGSDIEHEKVGPRCITLSSIALGLSRQIYERWTEVYAHFEKSEQTNWPKFSCAAFLSLPNRDTLPVAAAYSSARHITRSLAHDRELLRFRGLYPGSPRHTTDYAMRLAGMGESEIDRLTDHSAERSRSRMSPNSLEGPPSSELHSRGEVAVARYLGLIS